MLMADTTWGQYPLEVQFTGMSDLVVDSWIWDFGTGDSSFEQSPKYTYMNPGRFDVTLQIDAGGDIRTYETTNYITILADTVTGLSAQGEPGFAVVVPIHASNTVPIRRIKLPVEYGGLLNLQFDSFSTAGCRTDYFDEAKMISFDPVNDRMTFSMYNTQAESPDLEAGAGPILMIYFTIPVSATPDQTASIILDGYGSYYPQLFGPVLDYTPIIGTAMVSLAYVCGDANGDDQVNILDLTYMINYLYKSGPPPVPEESADTNGDGNLNILDVTYSINYIYKGGPEPVCQ
jgi:PKD repeat protein